MPLINGYYRPFDHSKFAAWDKAVRGDDPEAIASALAGMRELSASGEDYGAWGTLRHWIAEWLRLPLAPELKAAIVEAGTRPDR